ncbi:MFS transporter [Candidatus Paracaedibacter symbiosus]|uniref:MFS transporter n=1 Tax=Candidatus Paracaedibacter symbiosus TaxID=244582 RepID=UPI00069079EC|nr:MFS transporter [Candidatus Paracaedibacter symbiosus]
MANPPLQHQENTLPDTKIKSGLWGISWMSFFWSASSLMVVALLPTFLTEELGASHTKMGIIEGVAIFIAFLSKVFSGVLSDIFRTRKPLIAVGSLFTILVKLIFATASSIGWIFVARSLDRLSKGIRSSPTDALIADLSSKVERGKSYGLRQSLYTMGAVVGSFTAIVLMYVSDHNYRLVFLLSAIPATIALAILFKVVKQPTIQNELKPKNTTWQFSDIQFLPPKFWKFLFISFILMLARFSEAFITLRAKSVGWTITLLPILLIAMELVHAAVAYPMGKLSDRYSKKSLLLNGIITLMITNMVFLQFNSILGVLAGALLAGLHMGMTQGLLSTLVAESTPAELRGTAFALYYLSSGTAVLIGNTLAGHLSDSIGTRGPFYGGLIFTSIATACLYFMLRSHPKKTVEQEA